MITDDEIFLRWLNGVEDQELKDCLAQLDSINNLNNDPLALRRNGLKAARLAFRAGVRYAEAPKPLKIRS